jgi:hypothetical protein
VETHRREHQATILNAPTRRAFPKRWKWNETKIKKGTIIYLRRTDGSGQVHFLENDFEVSKHWINRLVRVEVDLLKGNIRFFALQRAEWKKHKLLKKIKFKITKNNKK